MINELNSVQLEEALQFAWKLQSKKESASLPVFQNIGEMRDSMSKFLAHDDDRILAFYRGNEMKAVVNLFVDRKEKYLKTSGAYVLSDYRDIYGEFFNYLENTYPGYEAHLLFPKENVDSAQAIQSLGAELIESSLITRLHSKSFETQHTNIVAVELTDERFKEFAAFYDAIIPKTMYWNSKRIREKRDQWKIYVAFNDNRIVAAILYAVWDPGDAEVFALITDPVFEALDFLQAFLSHSLSLIFKEGWKSVLFFVEDEDSTEKEAALSNGFRIEGNSQCFRLDLGERIP